MGNFKRVKNYIVQKLKQILRTLHTRRRHMTRTVVADYSTHKIPSAVSKGTPPITVCREQPKEVKSTEHTKQRINHVQVSMKCAKVVAFKDHLYVGGGYTSTGLGDSIVMKYNPKSESWEQLPPCPLKWFGMTVFKGQLVLIGGKEVQSKSYKPTNKIVIWEESSRLWNFSLSPMNFARVSPVVFSHGDYLIVTGGEKGSLDYNVEVFDSASQHWMIAPSLPTESLSLSSTVTGAHWCLLQGDCILTANIQDVIQEAKLLHNWLLNPVDVSTDLEEQNNKPVIHSTLSWRTLMCVPAGGTHQIVAINGRLSVLVNKNGCTHLYENDGGWKKMAVIPGGNGASFQVVENPETNDVFMIAETVPQCT